MHIDFLKLVESKFSICSTFYQFCIDKNKNLYNVLKYKIHSI